MGSENYFDTTVWINSHIESEAQMFSKTEEIETEIAGIEKKLLMYASADISKIVPKEWEESPIEFISYKMEELFEEYKSMTMLLQKLYLMAEIVEEKKTFDVVKLSY